MGGLRSISLKDFRYDDAADVYRCPAGELLRPMKGRKNGRWQNTSGRFELRYASRKAVCGKCRLKTRCLSPTSPYRIVARWEHEDVLERHRARMKNADGLMRRRSAIVEHPFGTIKCRAGYRHFLVRGFNKVRGEWSLMALCYNFTRLLNILGFDGFMARIAKALLSLLCAPAVLQNLIHSIPGAFWTSAMPSSGAHRLQTT
jgi:hypothetical protein